MKAACGLLGLIAVLGVLAACDPVHSDAVSALGPEAPGVPNGPLHRPGQPCLLCHDGALGDPRQFTVAGTVFQTSDQTIAAVGATVTLVDAHGLTTELTTNQAGNFYVTPDRYNPTFPMQVHLVDASGHQASMETLIEGNGTIEPNGSCASCHFNPPGPKSPGHVCVTLEDGGPPP